eukprot:SAG31_NODE_2603_length_5399_cov_2.741887_6_plen_66_part_00
MSERLSNDCAITTTLYISMQRSGWGLEVLHSLLLCPTRTKVTKVSKGNAASLAKNFALVAALEAL